MDACLLHCCLMSSLLISFRLRQSYSGYHVVWGVHLGVLIAEGIEDRAHEIACKMVSGAQMVGNLLAYLMEACSKIYAFCSLYIFWLGKCSNDIWHSSKEMTFIFGGIVGTHWPTSQQCQAKFFKEKNIYILKPLATTVEDWVVSHCWAYWGSRQWEQVCWCLPSLRCTVWPLPAPEVCSCGTSGRTALCV